MVFGQLLALAWWLASCWRLYRLARFFQLEGYDRARFIRWINTNPAERTYNMRIVSVLLVYSVSVLILSRLDVEPQPASSLVLLLSALALIAILLRTSQREVKQVFTRTQRAVRLVVTSFVVAGVLLLIGLIVIVPLVHSPFTAAGITAMGIVVFVIVPLALPIANVVMYPVEAAFRQVYLRNARTALQRANPTVIAITGSYGKTTTKEYVAHLLQGRYRVLKTPKSYNTLMGVSKVINQILPNDNSYDYFIVEMGAYIPGEIAAICRLTKPTISLVTAVGPMHLERFGSLENTAKAKYEIIQALPLEGAGIFNDDDPLVQAMHERGYPAMRIGVTRQSPSTPGARFSAHNVAMTASGLDFDVQDQETGEQAHLHAPVYGEHNVSNILMALAVARYVGISLAEAAMRVATLEPAEHRLVRRVLPNGVVTIDDAYSANPIGTRQALAVLNLNQTDHGKRIVITSGMVELGPIQDEENRKLGQAIAEAATDVVLINDRQTKPVQQGLADAKFAADHTHVVQTTADALRWMQDNTQSGDAVLIMSDLPDTY